MLARQIKGQFAVPDKGELLALGVMDRIKQV
jgi:hypothetical protein